MKRFLKLCIIPASVYLLFVLLYSLCGVMVKETFLFPLVPAFLSFLIRWDPYKS